MSMPNFRLLIYVLFYVCGDKSIFVNSINEAPARVTLRFQVSKLSDDSINDSRLKLCVDKGIERCYWTTDQLMIWDGEQFKDIQYVFSISNMAIDLTIDVKIKHLTKKIEYPRKTVNLMKFDSKTTFEIHSFNLESFITVTIEHECESGYYPPRQCTKACYPLPDESHCDSFGNKICKNGLTYESVTDRCVANNCLKSKIQCGNGRCVDNGEYSKCLCPENYYGENCQYRKPCDPNPCLNGGVCKPELNVHSFKCSCLPSFTDDRCQTIVPEKCPCPVNTKCNFSPNRIRVSCVPESDGKKSDIKNDSSALSPINDKLKDKVLDSRKKNDWNPITMTTTIIVAVGCIMLILCFTVSLYVLYNTRQPKNSKKSNNSQNPPSGLHSDFSPKFQASSFKRSLSLDNNSAYLPANSSILETLPNNFSMSTTGYSLQDNSYVEHMPSSFRQIPVYGGYIYQPEHQMTPLMLHNNYPKCSTGSSTSGCSMTTPPGLPPRSNDTEMTTFGTLPKPD